MKSNAKHKATEAIEQAVIVLRCIDGDCRDADYKAEIYAGYLALTGLEALWFLVAARGGDVSEINDLKKRFGGVLASVQEQWIER